VPDARNDDALALYLTLSQVRLIEMLMGMEKLKA